MRGVGVVDPHHGLAGGRPEPGWPEGEPADPDIGRARAGGAAAAHQTGQRDHEVLLLVGLVALEAARVVRVRVEPAVAAERRILPLAIADVARILGAPALALLHHPEADAIALQESPTRLLHPIS